MKTPIVFVFKTLSLERRRYIKKGKQKVRRRRRRRKKGKRDRKYIGLISTVNRSAE